MKTQSINCMEQFTEDWIISNMNYGPTKIVLNLKDLPMITYATSVKVLCKRMLI